ncbi:MAG: LysR family transcriptional regulator [Alphaproteobacteria bacterium]|nr:LysR family transcriptional regulator [Alphaproteobacteria bacterium]
MNLRQIEYFVRVAEERHFGRAARRLHITQPPLSQQIKALEEEMGVRLLERTTRSVELTPAGERFLQRARGLFAELEAATQEAQRVQEGLVGSLRLSFVGSATYALLPRVVRALRLGLPEVHLSIASERLTAAQVEALVAGELDLSIVSLDRLEAVAHLVAVERIRTTPLVAVLHEDHPLTGHKGPVPLEALADEPFLLHPSGGRSVLHRKVRELCRRAGFQPRLAQEVHETVTAVSLAAAGVGVAVLPDTVRALHIVGARALPLADPDAYLLTALAYRLDDERPLLRRALEVVRGAVGE